jgi:peroxiredoxin
MAEQELNPTPLQPGALAPQFSLQSTDGETITRSQFRNKNALVLVFYQPTPEAIKLLQALSRDEPEYKELGAKITGIGRAKREELQRLATERGISVTLLADPEGVAWKVYTGTDAPGYAVFVLDLYGGVDSQQVASTVDALPDAATILDWTRATQYRCNI